jgi:hypothetical protein
VTRHEHDVDSADSRSATAAAPGLFAPDLLLASQQAMARPPDSPCRRLVAAVFERALLDAVGPTAKQPDRDDALAWFASDAEEPFAFRWIAVQLGLDPDWVRGRIRRRQEAGSHPIPAEVAVLAAPEGDTDDGDQRAA